MFNRMITSGEIITYENAKRVIYDRYRFQDGEKLKEHSDQKIKENKTNTYCLYNNCVVAKLGTASTGKFINLYLEL